MSGGAVDLNLAEVDAVAEIALQFQQIVGVVGIAGLEAGIAVQQLGRQDVLLEGDVAETVALAGIVVQFDGGFVGLQVDLDGVLGETGVEITAFGGQRFQVRLSCSYLG